MTPTIRAKHVLTILAIGAVCAISVVAFLTWRSVTVERAEPDRAAAEFGAVRDRFSGTEPMLRVETDGRLKRRALPEGHQPPPLRLHVLAYRVEEGRLVRADVPMWFLRAKGPAINFSLRGTGLDLQRLGVTPDDLRRYGPGLILDETRSNGDRLLVWTD